MRNLNKVSHFAIIYILGIWGNSIVSGKYEGYLPKVGGTLEDAVRNDEDSLANTVARLSSIVKRKNDEIVNLNLIISRRIDEISQYQEQVNYCSNRLRSCKSLGNLSDIIQMEVPGSEPFEILCNGEIAGSGWLVIQQRIDENEYFSRLWNDYKNGFGYLKGNFFLGLEKIHQLTAAGRHELYIHMEASGLVFSAHYDNFVVGSEADQYELVSLGEFTPSANRPRDNMRIHEHKKFYTRDKDNSMKCGGRRLSGWWFDNTYECGDSSLNGAHVFYDNDITWRPRRSLSKIVMMIRPIDDGDSE